ncbi:MAG: hypothetical protein Q9164_002036 [Protoblastenia rupestris]
MRFSTLLLLSYAQFIACQGSLFPRVECSENFNKCAPKGALSTNEPAVGTGLAELYIDLVTSVSGPDIEAREIAAYLERDNYTTNYFLPGSSTGQIVSGIFNGPDGSAANLIDGTYTLKDGSAGNIYGSSDSPSKPDTATLPIPTQYTASGSGSAIPATALGQEVTYTTTIPGTTIPPSTISAQPMTATSVVNGSTLILAITEAVSTEPGTTVSPVTSTVTTRIVGPSATKESIGMSVGIQPGWLISVIIPVAMLAF